MSPRKLVNEPRSGVVAAVAALLLAFGVGSPAGADTLNGAPVGGKKVAAAQTAVRKVPQAKRTADGWYLYPALTEVNQYDAPTCYMATLVNTWNAEHRGRQIGQAEFHQLETAAEARGDRRAPGDAYDMPSWSAMDDAGYTLSGTRWLADYHAVINAAVGGPVYVEYVIDRRGIDAWPQSPGRGRVPAWTPSSLDLPKVRASGTWGSYLLYPHASVITGVNPSKKLLRLTNSWGQNWGYGGDVIVTYEDARRALMTGTDFTWTR